jgi:DNA repair protein RadC
MEDTNKWEISNLGEVTISYVFKGSLKDRPTITGSYDVYKIAMEVIDKGAMGMQEQFLAIYLNRANTVIGAKVHFIGGIASVIVDMKLILATAAGLMASGVIVCHNHPSGNLEPSKQDRLLTEKLKEVLGLLDIQLMDHLILSPDGKWLSFVERGIL